MAALMSRFLRQAALGLVFLMMVHGPASAHGLGVQCRPRGDQIEVEAYFSDDTPAEHASVRVTDFAGNLITEGTTDAHGRWRFTKPPAGRYFVTVDAGAGHVTRVALSRQLASEGPSREEFTSFPWLKLTIGVAAILLFGFGFFFARRRGK